MAKRRAGARPRLLDAAYEGTLLAASFIVSRNGGDVKGAKCAQKRAKALFPESWETVMLQFGNPDIPADRDGVVQKARKTLDAASLCDLVTVHKC